MLCESVSFLRSLSRRLKRPLLIVPAPVTPLLHIRSIRCRLPRHVRRLVAVDRTQAVIAAGGRSDRPSMMVRAGIIPNLDLRAVGSGTARYFQRLRALHANDFILVISQ